MSFSPDTLDIIVLGVTAGGTILGTVALILNSKKAPKDPVMEVKLSHVTSTVEKLGLDLCEIREEITSLTKEMAKDISEVRVSQGSLHARMESISKVIDEMPAKFARIVKALGK